MRITRTIRNHSRDEICGVVRRLREGSRVTFEDPEATDPQKIRLRITLDELAHRTEWHGRKLKPKEWSRMFLAAVRAAEVVPGIEDGTAFVLFEKDDIPSVDEASNMLELANKFAAERGFTLTEDSK